MSSDIESSRLHTDMLFDKEIKKLLISKFGIYDLTTLEKTQFETNQKVSIIFIVSTIVVDCILIEQMCIEKKSNVKVVQISSLPYNELGLIDKVQLELVPIINGTVADRLDTQIKDQYFSIKVKMKSIESVNFAKPIRVGMLPAFLSTPALIKKREQYTLAGYLNQTTINYPMNSMSFISEKGEVFGINYIDFKKRVQKIAGSFKEIKKGTPVLVQLTDQYDFVSIFWSSIWSGLISVPLACPRNYDNHDAIANKLVSTLRQLPECIVVCQSIKEDEIIHFLSLNQLSNIRVLAIENLLDSVPMDEVHSSLATDIAVFLMTSGSTGASKLVPQSHEHIINRTLGTISVNNFSPNDISLNWMPLDHVGGLVMFHVRDIIIGCDQFQVNTNYILQNPIRWMELCDKHGVTATWAPNFAFNLLNSFEENIRKAELDLSSVRFIMNAGESIVASQVYQFLKLFKQHGLRSNAVFPAWGMSETCSAVLFDSTFSLDNIKKNNRFVSVGKPIPGIEVQIVDDQNNQLKEGQNGRLLVRGGSVLDNYYGSTDSNNYSFFKGGWFDTGDIAVIEKGNISIVGRNKDVIIVNGYNLSSHEVEEFIDTLDGVLPSNTAVVPVRNKDNSSDNIAIFLQTSFKDGLKDKMIKVIRKRITQIFGINPQYILCIEPTQIPKTSIGKIQKGKLKQMLMEGKFKPDYTASKLEQQMETKKQILHRYFIQKNLENNSNDEHRCVLLFKNDRKMIDKNILADFSDVIEVKYGDTFHKNGEKEYVINNKENQYEKLFSEIFKDGYRPNTIIYSNEHESEDILSISYAETETLTLLRLLKAVQIAQFKIDSFLMINRRSLSVDNESFLPAYSTQIGFLRSASDEMATIAFKYIDTDSLLGFELVQEIYDAGKFDFEIAYRNGSRFVSKLGPIDENTPTSQIQIIENGRYVITGGLGEVAEKLSLELLEKKQASLLLLSRDAKENLSDEKKARLAKLEKYSTVKYQQVNLKDVDQLTAILEKENNEQSIDGIFHLAASLKQITIKETSELDFLIDLEPKVAGTTNLYEASKSIGLKFIVNFSSVNGFFGGTGVSSYTAANRYQEAITDWAFQQNEGPVMLNLSWSMWDNIGLSKQFLFKELTERRGFEILKHEKAFDLFWNVTQNGYKNTLLGINIDNQFMWPYFVLETENVKKLELHVDGKDDQYTTIVFKDDFGTSIPVNVIETNTKQNEVISFSSTDNLDEIDISERISAIFCEVLKLKKEEMDYEESLFDLGGHSLILPQIHSKIVDQLKVDLSLLDLFQYSSVNELTDYLEEKKKNEPAQSTRKIDLLKHL